MDVLAGASGSFKEPAEARRDADRRSAGRILELELRVAGRLSLRGFRSFGFSAQGSGVELMSLRSR